MPKAEKGNKVTIHYRGTLEDGTEFDSSHDGQPLEFTLGEGMVISGFENAVEGMESGEKKEISIPPEEAYGEPREDLVVQMDREQIPDNVDLELGGALRVRTEDGHTVTVIVADLSDDSVVLDGNHPLAGKTLNFELELVGVE